MSMQDGPSEFSWAPDGKSPFSAGRRIFDMGTCGEAACAPVGPISVGHNDSVLMRRELKRLHGAQHTETSGCRRLRKANHRPAIYQRAVYQLEGTFNPAYFYGFENQGNQEAVRPQVVLDSHDAPADC